jgi:molybdate transport system regulatory protein
MVFGREAGQGPKNSFWERWSNIRSKDYAMEIKFKVWYEKDGEVLFGSGRRELLKAVDKYNSLNAAAKHMKMSYRAAWGRLRASEERLGLKLVESHPPHRALQLTKEARSLIKKFDKLEQEMRDHVRKISKEDKQHSR